MHFTDVFSGKVGDSRERLMITWHEGLVPVVSSGYSIQDSGVTFCGWGGKVIRLDFYLRHEGLVPVDRTGNTHHNRRL